MLDILIGIVIETFVDGIKLLPFLFVTYFVMEFLEHKASDKTNAMVKKSGKMGPLIGGVLGVLPQCGFSTAASNFYAGRVITVGTLMAVYLSTSDEMLPILISEKAPIATIAKILLIKVMVGIVAGFIIDAVIRPKEEHEHIHEICEHEHCNCEKSIFKSSLFHTLQIFLYIVCISFVLNLIMEIAGENALQSILQNRPIIGAVLAGIVGLIPNCASSVALTKLFLENTLSLGAMLSGLLVNAGVGLLVLFRVNHNKKENFAIVAGLYGISVAVGILFSFI